VTDATARKDAEALRYRMVVRLALVANEAKSQGRGDVVTAAQTLRKELEGIEISNDNAGRAAEQLKAQSSKIDQLALSIGLPDHGMVVYPKWLRFAAWTSPALVVLGALAWIIERRSRKKVVTEAEIKQLEQTQS
jgi:hypothetical protein